MRAENEFLAMLRANPKLCYPDVTGASAIVEARLAEQDKDR